ncbi:lipopolysaccharide export system protein LptC [Azospirillum agricola]|uniref:LPS export ABC transporter periplasmic protein LptC n=1 Tax=Azospirillum agricola TaxID=1720247 RepID=UPI001AE3A5D5|nr:LPS export ABC transporter periplasmic protein LptC [Azospirillum agricola]MBP2228338.1 lipopolysaccharide export system protein LptC [Azospirillum agricola]
MSIEDGVQELRAEARPGTRPAVPPQGAAPAPALPLAAGPVPHHLTAASRAHRRRDTRPVSRVYSRFVSAMKFVLPAAALALVALLAAWPSLTSLPTPRIAADKGQSEMLKPRYFSLDEHNQPFSLVAAKADKSTDQPDIVLLDLPEAEMTETAGTWVTIRSDKGWYNQVTGILLMRGNVRVMRDDGNEFTTEEAETDIRKGNAWGDAPVTGQGPQGEINAKGFRMTDRGKTVVFLNQSKAEVQAAERPGSKKR